ncbi:MAG TPA: aminoglycoside phosphotransferase family protein [Ktedonobacterales bacterium]
MSANTDPKPIGKMHADELDIDEALVRRLLVAQFPQWADLPLMPVYSGGTDNAIYRLGDDLSVRLTRRESPQEQLDKELRWLPMLAPHLPLAIPVPLVMGAPGEGYPMTWSVNRWLPGENAINAPLADPMRAASDMADFLTALRQIDTTGGPLAGEHNFGRGMPLAERDAFVRESIIALEGMIDTDAATAAWEVALHAPVWSEPPVWVHGDLLPGNLLVTAGRLSGVIDFGGLGLGDPACDLLVAWGLFSRDAREHFRAALQVDDASWARGSGWALSIGVIALPYYKETNLILANIARRLIAEVLSDYRQG